MSKIMIVNEEHLEKLVEEYTNNRSMQNTLKARNTEIADALKEYAEKQGVQDSRGSSYTPVGDMVVGKQARRSKRKLDKAKAEEFFKNKGIWSSVIEVKEEISEDKVAELIEKEVISVDQLEELLEEERITYAIYVKERDEDMDKLFAQAETDKYKIEQPEEDKAPLVAPEKMPTVKEMEVEHPKAKVRVRRK